MTFTPCCLPILIGSLPLTDHDQAVELILDHAPQIPLWPQLPRLPGEGMVRQFISGFPGLVEDYSGYRIDTTSEDFQEQMASFYQDYLDCEETPTLLEQSRFALGDDLTRGFTRFMEALQRHNHRAVALKGQITGPVTIGIGVKDQDGKSIIYDDDLRDVVVKMIALKARWQVKQLLKHSCEQPPILFIDEPGIVSFGSSAFVGITREMVTAAVDEVVDAIQESGGLAGIHICANGDWSPALESQADIISFDAYFFFDNFILYREQLMDYLRSGKILAWGIVPTSDPEVIATTTSTELFSIFRQQIDKVAEFGIPARRLMQQTLIAPSCGTGSLSLELALKVIRHTQEVSAMARNHLAAY